MTRVPLLVSLWAGLLVLAACAPAATPTPASSIQDIIWQWQSVTN